MSEVWVGDVPIGTVEDFDLVSWYREQIDQASVAMLTLANRTVTARFAMTEFGERWWRQWTKQHRTGHKHRGTPKWERRYATRSSTQRATRPRQR